MFGIASLTWGASLRHLGSGSAAGLGRPCRSATIPLPALDWRNRSKRADRFLTIVSAFAVGFLTTVSAFVVLRPCSAGPRASSDFFSASSMYDIFSPVKIQRKARTNVLPVHAAYSDLASF